MNSAAHGRLSYGFVETDLEVSWCFTPGYNCKFLQQSWIGYFLIAICQLPQDIERPSFPGSRGDGVFDFLEFVRLENHRA